MKKCSKLEEVVSFILRRHYKVSDTGSSGGVNASFMYKQYDGKRVVFCEMSNFRIIDWQVMGEDSLSMQTMATGYTFKGNKHVTQSAQCILSNLAIINVYDFAAEFFSENSVDFAYTLGTRDANIQHIYEWIRGDTGTLRASWVNENNTTEQLLNRLSGGDKIIIKKDPSRKVDMDFDIE